MLKMTELVHLEMYQFTLTKLLPLYCQFGPPRAYTAGPRIDLYDIVPNIYILWVGEVGDGWGRAR